MAGLQAHPNMLSNHTTMFTLNYVSIRIGIKIKLYTRIKHTKSHLLMYGQTYVAQDQGISD